MAFSFLRQSISSKGILGVDIGTSSIKVVELEKKGGRFELTNYGIFELKDSTISQKADAWQSLLKMPDQEIAAGLKELVKKAKFNSTDVVASIPSFNTFATVIEMPYISNDDLARALPFEAKKYVPIPLEEVVLDWSIVGVANSQNSTEGSKPSTVEVYLAAVPKDETSRYQTIVKDTGLKLKAIELENSALIRAILGNDLSPTAIVNIGGRSTSIIIVNRGYERVNHNYEIGGFEITKAISQSLNVNLEKAEELKRKFGLKKGEDNIISESMISLIDMMVFETQKTIANYEELKKEKVSNILLIGGLTNMPGLLEYFKEKLGRNVVLGNPFPRLIHPRELDQITNELSSIFSVAIGLAMREV